MLARATIIPPSADKDKHVPPQRKKWSTPRVIVSEIENTEKPVNLTEVVTLVPIGSS